MSDPRDDDDTSTGRVTQGGHGPRRGHAAWWVIAFFVVVIGLVLFRIITHRSAPAEHGTTPVSGVGALTVQPAGGREPPSGVRPA